MKKNYHKQFFLIITLILSTSFYYSNGLYFSVKINTSKKSKAIKIDDYILLKKTNEYMMIGLFPKYLEAMKAKQLIKEDGYDVIEIIAFFNHSLISIEDAFTLMDNKNELDVKNNGVLLSEEEIKEMLANIQDDDFFYTIQMGLYTEKNIDDFFEIPEQTSEKVKTKGQLRYTYGTYKSYYEASLAVKAVRDQGLKDAFIIAFDSLERIPIERALEKEEDFHKE